MISLITCFQSIIRSALTISYQLILSRTMTPRSWAISVRNKTNRQLLNFCPCLAITVPPVINYAPLELNRELRACAEEESPLAGYLITFSIIFLIYQEKGKLDLSKRLKTWNIRWRTFLPISSSHSRSNLIGLSLQTQSFESLFLCSMSPKQTLSSSSSQRKSSSKTASTLLSHQRKSKDSWYSENTFLPLLAWKERELLASFLWSSETITSQNWLSLQVLASHDYLAEESDLDFAFEKRWERYCPELLPTAQDDDKFSDSDSDDETSIRMDVTIQMINPHCYNITNYQRCLK